MSNPSKSLLIIDDEPDMLQMLTFVLSMEGFEITTVPSGTAAIEVASTRQFDVVLTDIQMPGMNGFETLQALRNIDPKVQVIVTTGYATAETASQCREYGALDLIQKPFDVMDLMKLLDRAIEARSGS